MPGVSVLYSDANWDGALALIGGAGQKALKSISVHTETATRFLQVFDAAATADVTLGTTEPRLVIALASANDQVQRRFEGAKFQLGLVVAGTTTARGGTTGGTLNYTIEVG